MVANFIDCVAANSSDTPSDNQPFELIGRYVSDKTWVDAKTILFDEFERTESAGFVRAYARDIVRTLRRSPALMQCAGVLRERAEQTAGLTVHGNSDPRPRTLHHRSGMTVTGTRRELMQLTGLTYERVRDLVSNRRRYALGWSASAEEARRGPGKAGRPRKPPAPPPEAKAPEPEFFQESGIQFF